MQNLHTESPSTGQANLSLSGLVKATDITPRFPEALSSSLIDKYRSCPRAFFWEYCANRVPVVPSVHLLAGGAYADGMRAYRKAYYEEGLDFDSAVHRGVEAIIKTYGDFEPADGKKPYYRVIDAFLGYFDYFGTPNIDPFAPAKVHDSLAVEFGFVVPLPISNPETGDPILYAGRFDAIMQAGDARPFVYDDKTTGSMGESWAEKWETRGQLLGYIWGAREVGINVRGAIVRGAGILKTKLHYADTILMPPQWKLDDWYDSLLHTVRQIVADWKSLRFHRAWGEPCSQYGGCGYKDLCMTQTPAVPNFSAYQERTWSPVEVEHL